MNAEKNIFTKFIQVYTPSFLWDTLCQRKEGQGWLTGYTSSATAANGDAREPVFSVPYRAQRLVVWLLQ